jgi:hypothetical protein
MFDWDLRILENANTEQQFDYVRKVRNAELAATDWTQLADSTADKAAWATYRQALRDLPTQNADPKKIKFPVAPNGTPTS